MVNQQPNVVAPTPQEVDAARAGIAAELSEIHAIIDAHLVTASKGLMARKRREAIERARVSVQGLVSLIAEAFVGDDGGVK